MTGLFALRSRAARPAGRRPRSAGFTLIELLVVLVILGTLVGMAVLATGNGGQARELREEANRLSALIGVLSDEAVLDNREYGLRLDAGSYEVLQYDETEGRWSPTDPVRRHTLPTWAELTVQLDGPPLRLAGAEPRRKADAQHSAEPQLLVLSSGELSPFSVALALRDGPRGDAWQLSSDGFNLPEAAPVEAP